MLDTTAARLKDLETVLRWEGIIDNARVRELLGVQPVWASRLLAQLVQITKKSAYRETSHSPLKLRPARPGQGAQKTQASADEYLKVLAASGELGLQVEDARQDLTQANPGIFVAVAQAVRTGNGLDVFYRSFTNPQGTQRVIFPHAIVRAPRRWHVRAWCESSNEFRDFNLGRIAQAALIENQSPKARAADRDWNTIVTVEVVAHPALTEQQQQMIAMEFYPRASARKLSIRRCLVGYTIQDLRIATDVNAQRPPEYQLCVVKPQKILPLFGPSGLLY
jgi:predicted DNA-binding transcriptional regulator YafY